MTLTMFQRPRRSGFICYFRDLQKQDGILSPTGAPPSGGHANPTCLPAGLRTLVMQGRNR